MTALVSLTFDDALDQHLDQAIPILESCGLLGTFYAHISAPSLALRTSAWRAAAERGHELGNHTIFHPADGRKHWVQPGNAIESYTVDRMRLELQVANQALQMLDGLTQRTFAYPCSNSVVGQPGWGTRLLRATKLDRTRIAPWIQRTALDWQSAEQDYAPITREFFVACRGGGMSWDQLPPPDHALDRWRLPSPAIQGEPLSTLQTFTERAVAEQRWAILQFHGIGGGHWMDCTVATFRDYCRWLADRAFAPVVTVRDGAKLVFGSRAEQSAQPLDNQAGV